MIARVDQIVSKNSTKGKLTEDEECLVKAKILQNPNKGFFARIYILMRESWFIPLATLFSPIVINALPELPGISELSGLLRDISTNDLLAFLTVGIIILLIVTYSVGFIIFNSWDRQAQRLAGEIIETRHSAKS